MLIYTEYQYATDLNRAEIVEDLKFELYARSQLLEPGGRLYLMNALHMNALHMTMFYSVMDELSSEIRVVCSQ